MLILHKLSGYFFTNTVITKISSINIVTSLVALTNNMNEYVKATNFNYQ